MAGSRLSRAVPRRQATRMPSRVPSVKLITVATPTRASVQGRPELMTLVTVAG